MQIDRDRFRELIKKYFKHRWENPDDEWALRQGGGEIYIQEKVLKKASEFLKKEKIEAEPKKNLIYCLKAHFNLLSKFENGFAIHFIENSDEKELQKHFTNLLYSSDNLENRLRSFLQWSEVRKINSKKTGINSTVCSYFLSMSDPQVYPFCKPVAYNFTVNQVFLKSETTKDPIQRIIHCQEIYTALLSILEREFGLKDGNLLDVHSICFLSHWQETEKSKKQIKIPLDKDSTESKAHDPELPDVSNEEYNKEKELKELFIDDGEFQKAVNLLGYKKNIILQGPPGVGKTFIARHIAWAMMGKKDKSRIGLVQFHQSYAYEDFVQGFRPDENATFVLKNGIFYEFCRQAGKDKKNDYFFIIDEINRGNLSKIMGELMMLIEPDKRDSYDLPLAYAKSKDDKFSVPSNLYIIGTMNTADRSLAMVDYALRRRFCFINLKPAFGTEKFNQFLEKKRVDKNLIQKINDRFNHLNNIISNEKKDLGPDFCIGHSYFCNCQNIGHGWYESIIEYEIAPLLNEYWFDNKEKADEQVKLLLE